MKWASASCHGLCAVESPVTTASSGGSPVTVPALLPGPAHDPSRHERVDLLRKAGGMLRAGVDRHAATGSTELLTHHDRLIRRTVTPGADLRHPHPAQGTHGPQPGEPHEGTPHP